MLYFSKKLKKKGKEVAAWALIRSEHLWWDLGSGVLGKSFPGDSKMQSRVNPEFGVSIQYILVNFSPGRNLTRKFP